MIRIYSWNNGDGSKLLAEAMGIKRIKHNNSRYVPRDRDTIINWGASHLAPKYNITRIINDANRVREVIDKEIFFRHYDDHANFNVPPFFFGRQQAEVYLRDNPGTTLVARTVLRGHEGKGIILIDKVEDMVYAPLYTQYIKKKAEYRIHVVNGQVIDEVQKKRKLEHDGGDTRIRNTANGYVFARTNVVIPECVRSAAVEAVKFYQLDFGAVDVIYNEKQGKAYVLEINTAPGIEGTTVTRYAEAFKAWLGV